MIGQNKLDRERVIANIVKKIQPHVETKKFSKERRARLIASLKKDPVPISEVVDEVVADIRADMIILNSYDKPEGKPDYDLLNQMDKTYWVNHKTDAEKAINAMEIIYSLRDKYHTLRVRIR